MKQILMAYEDNLSDVSNELDDSKDNDGTFEVVKEDLESLKFAINKVKDSHRRFIKKTLITC